jgi:transcriptional regulator with XRE-family HTH domain
MGRPTSKPRPSFGDALAKAREAAGLSQKQLADKLGISQRAVCWWEREPVALKPEQLAALADALGVSADELIGRKAARHRGGPAGKARRAFEALNELSRARQQRILEFVEAMIIAEKKETDGRKAA